MDYKNFNKNIILSTLLAIGIVSALNYQMDAFDVFHTKNRFNTYKPDIDKNHRLSKIPAFKLTQEKVDAIWVGSSKTGWNSNEEYEKSILNKNIKNLALNGGSFYESITMAKNAILIHPEIKTIYFGIDFCKMSKAVEKADALKPTTNNLTKAEILPLLISLDTAQHSIKTFSKNLKQKQKTTEPYGAEKQYHKKVWRKFEHTVNDFYKENYKNYEFDTQKIEDLKDFIKWCYEKNVKVVLFTTTMHMAERILINHTDNLEAFYAFKEELAQIQPYYDFAVVNKYTTEKISPEMQCFKDAVHPHPFVRKKMSNKLFGLNEDFGYLATKHNIKKHNKQDQKAFETYINNNKELVKKVESWSK